MLSFTKTSKQPNLSLLNISHCVIHLLCALPHLLVRYQVEPLHYLLQHFLSNTRSLGSSSFFSTHVSEAYSSTRKTQARSRCTLIPKNSSPYNPSNLFKSDILSHTFGECFYCSTAPCWYSTSLAFSILLHVVQYPCIVCSVMRIKRY